MKIEMNSAAAVDRWAVVNDGVMGGLSKGYVELQDGHMAFTGNVNTNGGGFTSIRLRTNPDWFAEQEGVRLTVRPDDRRYSVTFRTNQSWRGRNISWQTDLPELPIGEWSEVMVPFSALRATVFGRDVRGGEFDSSDIRQMGLIIADGVDGPFRLDVAAMECL